MGNAGAFVIFGSDWRSISPSKKTQSEENLPSDNVHPPCCHAAATLPMPPTTANIGIIQAPWKIKGVYKTSSNPLLYLFGSTPSTPFYNLWHDNRSNTSSYPRSATVLPTLRTKPERQSILHPHDLSCATTNGPCAQGRSWAIAKREQRQNL